MILRPIFFALITFLPLTACGEKTEETVPENRLAKEKSPYLRQHAKNPVDWYPWGEEAFAAAREQNKPIFLSVGYSTCHWCHVMARESFSNKEITAAWKKDEKDIRAQAGQMTERLREIASGSGTPAADLPPASLLDKASASFTASYDEEHGGFTPAPKFPRPAVHDFLHHYASIKGTDSESGKNALAMSAATLTKMADGGIYDHLGGGFHRYSVDIYWHIPHYEKMLYDQAQLVIAYLDAAHLTGDASQSLTAQDGKATAYVCLPTPPPTTATFRHRDHGAYRASLAGDPIEPPWQAIKEWIPDDEPDLDWFNRPRNPNEPDPDWFDQTPIWKAPEIHLDDGRILVLEYT